MRNVLAGKIIPIVLMGLAVSAGAAEWKPYQLQAGDALEITVWNEETLQRSLVVMPDGRISYPLVGHIKAAGLNAEELEAQITDRLTAYIAGPEVNVSVTGVTGNLVYVIGQVNKPGPITMTRNLSVIQALSVAGGFTPYANSEKVRVIRSIDGQERVLPFDYKSIEKNGELNTNHTLMAGDVIIVP